MHTISGPLFDAVRFRVRLFWFAVFTGVMSFILITLVVVLQLGQESRDGVLLFLVAIPFYYLWIGVLLPILKTFPFIDRYLYPVRSDTIQVPSLQEILVSRRGFQWFLVFSSNEFSSEHALCWQAMQRFKEKTSVQQLKDIQAKYLDVGAPLLVNISHSSQEAIINLCNQIHEGTHLEQIQGIFDNIQKEIYDVMQNDTYHRFIRSDAFAHYLRNDPCPKFLDREQSVSMASSVTMPTSPSIHHTQRTLDLELVGGYGESKPLKSDSVSTFETGKGLAWTPNPLEPQSSALDT